MLSIWGCCNKISGCGTVLCGGNTAPSFIAYFDSRLSTQAISFCFFVVHFRVVAILIMDGLLTIFPKHNIESKFLDELTQNSYLGILKWCIVGPSLLCAIVITCIVLYCIVLWKKVVLTLTFSNLITPSLLITCSYTYTSHDSYFKVLSWVISWYESNIWWVNSQGFFLFPDFVSMIMRCDYRNFSLTWRSSSKSLLTFHRYIKSERIVLQAIDRRQAFFKM